MIYKVICRVSDIFLYSAIVGGNSKREYSIEEWTVAQEWLVRKDYGLCAFTNLEDAKDFLANLIGYGSQWEIWECEGKDEIKEIPSMCNVHDLKYGILCETTHTTWPSGTAMYKSIRLIRKIENVL